jgi:hypothetical protein
MLGDKISISTRANVINALETRILKPMDRHFDGDPDILRRHGWKGNLIFFYLFRFKLNSFFKIRKIIGILFVGVELLKLEFLQ